MSFSPLNDVQIQLTFIETRHRIGSGKNVGGTPQDRALPA